MLQNARKCFNVKTAAPPLNSSVPRGIFLRVVGCAYPEVRAMRTLAVIFLLFCAIVQGLAQRSVRSELADTSVITHFGIAGPEFSVSVPVILLPSPSIDAHRSPLVPPYDILSGLGLRSIPRFIDSPSPPIISTLAFEPSSGRDLRTVRIVLGVIQAAGAGYALYEHLRRYRDRY